MSSNIRSKNNIYYFICVHNFAMTVSPSLQTRMRSLAVCQNRKKTSPFHRFISAFSTACLTVCQPIRLFVMDDTLICVAHLLCARMRWHVAVLALYYWC